MLRKGWVIAPLPLAVLRTTPATTDTTPDFSEDSVLGWSETRIQIVKRKTFALAKCELLVTKAITAGF